MENTILIKCLFSKGMDDIVLVTSDSVRYDYIDEMENMSSLDSREATTVGHYTRPSLSTLISSNYASAVKTTPTGTSLAEVLKDKGYTTIGLPTGGMTDEKFGFGEGFDYFENFSTGGENAFSRKTSKLREIFGGITITRGIYRLFRPMGAVLDDIPPAEKVIDEAIQRFNDADSPRFLWIHLNDTHRPYGRGDKGVPTNIDRKSELADPNTSILPSVTKEEKEKIISEYRRSLRETDEELSRLLAEIDSEPVFVFSSDHGEEFGEEGYYYHQGRRRRTPDTIVDVPLCYKNIEFPEDGQRSLIDIAPTLLGSQGIDIPDEWDGKDLNKETRKNSITIATWKDKSNVLIKNEMKKLRFKDSIPELQKDGDEVNTDTEADEEIKEKLEKLGYTGVG
jgi:arylsulfatase A-like enzyme